MKPSSLLKKGNRTVKVHWTFAQVKRDEIFMQKIISLFAEQYGLTRSEVMAEIENVFSSVLSRWYQIEVMVFFRSDLQLEAVAYNMKAHQYVISFDSNEFCKSCQTVLRHCCICSNA